MVAVTQTYSSDQAQQAHRAKAEIGPEQMVCELLPCQGWLRRAGDRRGHVCMHPISPMAGPTFQNMLGPVQDVFGFCYSNRK